MLTRLFRTLCTPVVALILTAQLTVAETGADVEDLFDVLGLPEIVQIMHEEGIVYGQEIAGDLFAGAVPAEWTDLVAAIYDPARMEAEAKAALAEVTEGRDLAPLIAFFTTEPGRTFIELEVSARRALLDEDVETAAKEAAAIALMDETPRADLIGRFVETNDLVETNVMAAMNSTYAFYLGMMDGGAFPSEMTEDEMLANVWSQETQIRANTSEWVYSFLLMAYSPVSDADLETYIAFSRTEDGRLLNRAVFGAFDNVFEGISLSLGRAAARFVGGQEL